MSSPTSSLFGAEQASKQAILLLNLGSPASPAVADVHSYLLQFLMDRRIIGLPYWVRHPLVHRIIVPRRAPLASLSSVEEVLIAPLYPHYARSSYETAVAYVLEEARRLGLSLRFRLLPPFYRDEGYRQVLSEQVRPYLSEPFDRLIVSMHGIPLSHIPKECRHHNGHTDYCAHRRGWHERHAEEDCYRLQCEETRALLQQDLGLEDGQVELVYQSRLGRHEWMRPYMSERIQRLAHEGAERIVVVCPGFVCDCLETIQEIDSYYRSEYLHSGGKSFTYVPCLNSSPAFVRVLGELIERTMADPSALLSEENKRKYKYEH